MSWKFELLMKPEGELITEGPVWTGEEILFTHIRRSRILRTTRKPKPSRYGARISIAPTACASTRREGSSAVAPAGARSCALIPMARPR